MTFCRLSVKYVFEYILSYDLFAQLNVFLYLLKNRRKTNACYRNRQLLCLKRLRLSCKLMDVIEFYLDFLIHRFNDWNQLHILRNGIGDDDYVKSEKWPRYMVNYTKMFNANSKHKIHPTRI